MSGHVVQVMVVRYQRLIIDAAPCVPMLYIAVILTSIACLCFHPTHILCRWLLARWRVAEHDLHGAAGTNGGWEVGEQVVACAHMWEAAVAHRGESLAVALVLLPPFGALLADLLLQQLWTSPPYLPIRVCRHDVAADIGANYHNNVIKCFEETGTIWVGLRSFGCSGGDDAGARTCSLDASSDRRARLQENMSPERAGEPGDPAKGDFVG